jgi:VWFA-related protein
MTALRRAAARALALSLLVYSLLHGQPPDTEAFRTGISLVHVDAEILDANHRVLTGMQKNDFLILDNGRPQSILSMASEEQPPDLILLFDISLSMRGVVQRIAGGAGQAFQQLRSGDRVCVMTFNSRSAVLFPFSDDLSAAQRAVKETLVKERFGGGTKIQNAVVDAGEQMKFQNRVGRRRAILIVTDDVGIRTRREESVVSELWAADASLNGVIVRDAKFTVQRRVTQVLSPETLLLQAGMQGIAEKTGGDVLHSSDGSAAFQEMMRRIRSRISLYYHMPDAKPGDTRRVQVELSSAARQRFPDATVHARRGYVIPWEK